MYIAEEKYRPFVVTALTGCVLLVLTGGFVHAYIVSIDWENLRPTAVSDMFHIRPFVALVVFGLVYGFGVEVAKFLGATLRSEGLVLLFPLVAGAIIGSFQGTLVSQEVWGFIEYGVPFRSADTRTESGAVIGLLLAYPAIFASISFRRRFGMPW
jgi:glucose-6-phosphate-specific signal transduction histidine kinase